MGIYVYIRNMANKKRDRNSYKKQLGRYRLNRADLLAIEKILWIYADAREMRNTGAILPHNRKHMPRRSVDRYASIGRYRPFHLSFGRNEFGIHYAGVDWIYREDSVKFLSKRGYPRQARYIELAAWPGIKLTFTPRSTIIYAQTHYATGDELRLMKQSVSKIENYLLTCKQTRMNKASLTRT